MRVKKTKVEEVNSYTFTASELRRKLGLPSDARLFVSVPGGGDWSNTELEIDGDSKLQAQHTTVVEKTEEFDDNVEAAEEAR